MKIFCSETMQQRKELWEEVKCLCRESQIAYLSYRSTVAKTRKDQSELK